MQAASANARHRPTRYDAPITNAPVRMLDARPPRSVRHRPGGAVSLSTQNTIPSSISPHAESLKLRSPQTGGTGIQLITFYWVANLVDNAELGELRLIVVIYIDLLTPFLLFS